MQGIGTARYAPVIPMSLLTCATNKPNRTLLTVLTVRTAYQQLPRPLLLP
jgi:hypothetical protein